MKVFAISDLHLGNSVDKPMDVFGDLWDNQLEILTEDWRSRVSADDLVLLAGDLSWAMRLDEAVSDLQFLDSLPGRKILLKGNHDLWWSTRSKVEAVLPPSITLLQHDAVRYEGVTICGTRGWAQGAETDADLDKKIYSREVIRAQMALDDMRKKRHDGDYTIMMFHYPPFEANRLDTPFMDIVREGAFDFVVYGHLHGRGVRTTKVLDVGRTRLLLTSSDIIGHRLVELL